MPSIESESFSERMRAAVNLSWIMFSRKVGNGLVPINKEASMQLQYAYVLQQLLPLITFHENENFEIELETGVQVNGRSREIDLLFKGEFGEQKHTIAIEMKCYRTLAASGGARGATDIFMKDVYEDFYLLEQYVLSGIAHEGVSLVMNDLLRLVNPKNKNAKCWDYDISNGANFGPVNLTTPIGGKPVNISLEKAYNLSWVQYGEFWFMEAQGVHV
ncbi:hypothetical protein [Teredinibacter turnerae]|uniref:hypothetical protein n=1 Tax=Teredinibacter turnerae TaxID=2426 RepID=UPI0018AD4E9E|nr:hypothetical protein [Teredinibacter turnerae]